MPVSNELDALAEHAPNVAAVRMIADLRGVSVQQVLVDQLADWRGALDDSIERHSAEAAIYISQAEDATDTRQKIGFFANAQTHLDQVARLANARVVAEQMLSDSANNPIECGRTQHPASPSTSAS
ncbi:hypothetical protein [Williamsia muralis]|uniref:Uncharacterized protein n=1 Tax=Williamsia marianensis TaxID=85044 RepID=A0ABU4F1E1_WILMA|nr:hypothetical protein [Williamsia muralis]MDV7136709.1 hypothetical protein [Williamsia muralis]